MNPIVLAHKELKVVHKKPKSCAKTAEFLFSLLLYSKLKQNASQVESLISNFQRISLLLEEHSCQISNLTSIQQTDTLRISSLEEEKESLQQKVGDLLQLIESLEREHTCELLQHRKAIEENEQNLERLKGERTKYLYIVDLIAAILAFKIARSPGFLRLFRARTPNLGKFGELVVLFCLFKGIKGLFGNGKMLFSR